MSLVLVLVPDLDSLMPTLLLHQRLPERSGRRSTKLLLYFLSDSLDPSLLVLDTDDDEDAKMPLLITMLLLMQKRTYSRGVDFCPYRGLVQLSVPLVEC